MLKELSQFLQREGALDLMGGAIVLERMLWQNKIC